MKTDAETVEMMAWTLSLIRAARKAGATWIEAIATTIALMSAVFSAQRLERRMRGEEPDA